MQKNRFNKQNPQKKSSPNIIISQDGVILDDLYYEIDHVNKVFKSDLEELVINCFDKGWTFELGNYCVVRAGDKCTFKAGHSCVFVTNSYCRFETSNYCTFITKYQCQFNTGYNCLFTTQGDSAFKTKDSCNFDTGDGCKFITKGNCTFDVGMNCEFFTGEGCSFILNNIATQKFKKIDNISTVLDKDDNTNYILNDELKQLIRIAKDG